MCEKSNLLLRGIFITNECLTNRVNYTNSPVDEGGKSSSLFIILPTLSIFIPPQSARGGKTGRKNFKVQAPLLL